MIKNSDNKIVYQWFILKHIEKHKFVSKQDLMSKFQVSEKTIMRYSKTLSACFLLGNSQKLSGLTNVVKLENNIVEMHFSTEGREGLMRKILKWGGCAEVISPEDFRQEVMGRLRRLMIGIGSENNNESTYKNNA